MNAILEILAKNATATAEQIAAILNRPAEEVRAEIQRMEEEKIIFGRKVLINWEKVENGMVSALIEINVSPQRGEGFSKVAERICRCNEVKSLSLMSGGCDMMAEVEGRSLKEIALFVAEQLAPIDGVLATTTHFRLQAYKTEGVMLSVRSVDERKAITL